MKKELFYKLDKNGQYVKLNPKYIDQLIMLIKYSQFSQREEFIEIIRKCQELELNNWIEYFERLVPSEKLLLKDFFFGLFYIGMLTRRWLPDTDGENYPIEEEGTRHGDRDISEEQMTIILNTAFLLFKESILDQLSENIKELYDANFKTTDIIQAIINELYKTLSLGRGGF